MIRATFRVDGIKSSFMIWAVSTWELPSFSQDRGPITYVKGVPVHLTTLIAFAHFVALLVCTGVIMAGHEMALGHFDFVTNWEGLKRFWTLATFPFIHDIRLESLFFVIEILIFLWLGREVEGFVGRKAFALMYVSLVIAPALLLVALYPWTNLGSLVLQGSRSIHFGVFIAFVTIYPNVQFFFGLIAKWLAAIFLTVYSLFYMAQMNWPGLIYLWACAGTGFFAMRACGVGTEFNFAQKIASWQEERKEKRRVEAQERARREEEALNQSVDGILDKIAEHGINSLTEQERSALERARTQLLEQEKAPGGRRRHR